MTVLGWVNQPKKVKWMHLEYSRMLNYIIFQVLQQKLS